MTFPGLQISGMRWSGERCANAAGSSFAVPGT